MEMIAIPLAATAAGVTVGATIDDDDDGLVLLTLLDLPMPLRVYIFNYLGETQEARSGWTLLFLNTSRRCAARSDFLRTRRGGAR
jgi:hypothetical protein